jgi:hypothetical protein
MQVGEEEMLGTESHSGHIPDPARPWFPGVSPVESLGLQPVPIYTQTHAHTVLAP